jgi:hypothetical protein
MRNQQPLDLFKQGVATTWNTWREEHTPSCRDKGRRTPLPRCGRPQSSGGWAASVPMGRITPFGCQKSLGGGR